MCCVFDVELCSEVLTGLVIHSVLSLHPSPPTLFSHPRTYAHMYTAMVSSHVISHSTPNTFFTFVSYIHFVSLLLAVESRHSAASSCC